MRVNRSPSCFLVSAFLTGCASLSQVEYKQLEPLRSALWVPSGSPDVHSIVDAHGAIEDSSARWMYLQPGQVEAVVSATEKTYGSTYEAYGRWEAKAGKWYMLQEYGPYCNWPVCIYEADRSISIPVSWGLFSKESYRTKHIVLEGRIAGIGK